MTSQYDAYASHAGYAPGHPHACMLTHTYKYAILIAFPRQRASLLHYTYIACLVKNTIIFWHSELRALVAYSHLPPSPCHIRKPTVWHCHKSCHSPSAMCTISSADENALKRTQSGECARTGFYSNSTITVYFNFCIRSPFYVHLRP